MTVPCGKCAECVKDQQNEFVIRTVEEQKKRGTVLFVTLTYNEDSVPIKFDEDGEIVDEDTGELQLSDIIDEETGEVYPSRYRSLRRSDVVE